MSKYDALRSFLEGQHTERLPMTFAEIERVLGFKLPKSQAFGRGGATIPTTT